MRCSFKPFLWYKHNHLPTTVFPPPGLSALTRHTLHYYSTAHLLSAALSLSQVFELKISHSYSFQQRTYLLLKTYSDILSDFSKNFWEITKSTSVIEIHRRTSTEFRASEYTGRMLYSQLTSAYTKCRCQCLFLRHGNKHVCVPTNMKNSSSGRVHICQPVQFKPMMG